MFNDYKRYHFPISKTVVYVEKGAVIGYSIFRDNNIVMIFQLGNIFNLIIQKEENGGYECILKS